MKIEDGILERGFAFPWTMVCDYFNDQKQVKSLLILKVAVWECMTDRNMNISARQLEMYALTDHGTLSMW